MALESQANAHRPTMVQIRQSLPPAFAPAHSLRGAPGGTSACESGRANHSHSFHRRQLSQTAAPGAGKAHSEAPHARPERHVAKLAVPRIPSKDRLVWGAWTPGKLGKQEGVKSGSVVHRKCGNRQETAWQKGSRRGPLPAQQSRCRQCRPAWPEFGPSYC